MFINLLGFIILLNYNQMDFLDVTTSVDDSYTSFHTESYIPPKRKKQEKKEENTQKKYGSL